MCFAPPRRAIFGDQLHKLLRECGVLWILTVKCASPPPRRAIFGDRNFKNCSVNVVFCAFLTVKSASRHSGVPFFMSLLNSYLRTRRFSKPTFRRSGTTNHWENAAIRDFPNIWRVCIFFLVTLRARWSSFCWLDFPTLLFNCPYCGSYTSNFLR